MIDPIHVLGHAAGRPDCPPDIAAAILWSIQNLDRLVAVEPLDTEVKERGLTYPGRKPSIAYDDAVKVFNEWKTTDNIALAARNVGVTYSQAWNVIHGKTYPEVSGKVSVVLHDPVNGRKTLSPDQVREILKASENMKIGEIVKATDVPYATVQSIVNRRTVISREIATELGLDTPPVDRRRKRAKS